MNVQIPNLSNPQRELLEKYLPVVLAVGVAWLAARGLKKVMWNLFGLYCALHFGGFMFRF